MDTPKAHQYFDIIEIKYYIYKTYDIDSSCLDEWIAKKRDLRNGILISFYLYEFLDDPELDPNVRKILEIIDRDICKPNFVNELVIHYWW